VHQSDFLDALEKLVLGPARNVVMSPGERERVAYHEGGHTVLGLLVPGADPVNRVTIMPRGQALGVTYQRPEDDRHNYSEEYLRARITGAMGGRAAEEVIYGGRTTGAENDIQQATDLARQMVTRWGMSERLGPVTLAQRDDPFLRGDALAGLGGGRSYSEATAKVVDDEVERILQECYADGVRLLTENREALDRLARALLEQETLDEQEILRVTQLPPAPRSDESPIAAMPAAAFTQTRRTA
jgi:cell division protease FtsH